MFRETLKIRLWAALKIPHLFFIHPSVVELDDHHCVVRVALTRRTRNHLGSLYFGSLCAGADTAGGLIAFREIERTGGTVSLIQSELSLKKKGSGLGALGSAKAISS